MAGLTEAEVYEVLIYLIELNDAVIGGANGIANLQAKQLANRTAWLKANKQDKDATLTALAGLVTAADKMIYSTGSDAFSTTTLTAFARTLLDDADAAAMRATLGAQPAGSYQASDATLTALAGLVTAADKMIYATAADTFSTTTLTAFARTLLDDVDAAAMRATIGAQPAGSYQASDATLTALAGLVTAADKMIYATAADTFSTTTLTAFARTLLDDVDAAAMRATLGVIDGIGVEQTWQNMNASRAVGVTYTNSTGKPIFISISVTTTINTSTSVTIDGLVGVGYAGSVQAGLTISLTFIVPSGSTYSVTGGTLYKWYELR